MSTVLHSTGMRRIGGRARSRPGGTVVGVISDTHGVLRPEAVAAFADVDLIVHAGDIGSDAVLDRLRQLAPVIAVRGNNDRTGAAASLPAIVVTEVGRVRLCVVHDIKELRGDPTSQGVDIVIYGHSHRPSIERQAHLLLLNPGSAGPRRFTLPITVARLHVRVAGLRAEIVDLARQEVNARSAAPPTRSRTRNR